VRRIALLLLRQSSDRLFGERKIRFQAGEDVAEHLLDHGGFDPTLGARPMRGAVQRLVEAPLADAILAGRIGPGEVVHVRAAGGAISFGR
jgi:ATP-dependent Clp protease ATP-binding subunit ClpC